MWATISLIVSNWGYFLKLYKLLESGVTELQVKRALDGIDKAFEKNKTEEDSKNAAKSVNDIFRK